MSFILSMTTNGAIMMAADNALSVMTADGWHTENECRKLYTTPHNMGISAGGDARTKNGTPMLKLLREFIDNLDVAGCDTPMKTAQALLSYMRSFCTENKFTFHLCGYEIIDGFIVPQIVNVQTYENEVELKTISDNPECIVPVILWRTAIDMPVLLENIMESLEFWASAENALRLANLLFATMSNFTNRIYGARVVGEKPDILAIYPFKHEWVYRNELNGGGIYA